MLPIMLDRLAFCHPRRLTAALLLATLAARAGAGLAQEAGDFFIGFAEVRTGDTIVITETRIRLFGITAPSMREPPGLEARAGLAEVAAKSSIECTAVGVETWKQKVFKQVISVCRTVLDIPGDLASFMLRRGWAEARRDELANTRLEQPYLALEAAARTGCKGLWAARDECRGQ